MKFQLGVGVGGGDDCEVRLAQISNKMNCTERMGKKNGILAFLGVKRERVIFCLSSGILSTT